MELKNIIRFIEDVLIQDQKNQIPRQRWKWRIEEVLWKLKEIQKNERSPQ